jgi:ADP-ribose pyrophosphatase YjhB (NUDIX family)
VNREYPSAPIPAVGTVIRQDDRIVLIRRAKEPYLGWWTFPGGAIEVGERIQDAARREALEETGLQVEIEDVVAVIDNVVRDEEGAVRYHYLIVDYLARTIGGSLQPGTDVSDARWVDLDGLDCMRVTDKAAAIVRDVLGSQTSGYACHGSVPVLDERLNLL